MSGSITIVCHGLADFLKQDGAKEVGRRAFIPRVFVEIWTRPIPYTDVDDAGNWSDDGGRNAGS